jgi:hypothetical protein
MERIEEGRRRGRRGEGPVAALDAGQRRVQEVGEGADERPRAVSDWGKKEKTESGRWWAATANCDAPGF